MVGSIGANNKIKEITELKQSQLDSFKSMSEAFKNIGYDKQK